MRAAYLQVVDHPDFGPVTLPNSPLRLHGAAQAPAAPSPALGADNAAVYGGMLGLSAAEIEALRTDGVI